VRGDDDTPCLGDGPVGGQDVRRGADLHAPLVQFLQRDVQAAQEKLQFPQVGLGAEDAQDVKAEGGGELKTGQDQDFRQQAAIFAQLFFLFFPQAAQLFQQLQVVDFLLHPPVSRHRVVVGKGDDVQPLALRLPEDVQEGNPRLLVVGGGGGMEVQVHAPPLGLAFGFSFSGHKRHSAVLRA